MRKCLFIFGLIALMSTPAMAGYEMEVFTCSGEYKMDWKDREFIVPVTASLVFGKPLIRGFAEVFANRPDSARVIPSGHYIFKTLNSETKSTDYTSFESDKFKLSIPLAQLMDVQAPGRGVLTMDGISLDVRCTFEQREEENEEDDVK